MKNKFDNIEEVFQNTFDGFEADVDPSVWNNVQNSINNSVGNSSSSSSNLSISSSVGKAIFLKIAAAVVAVATLATATYLITKDKEVKPDMIVNSENIPLNTADENSEVIAVKVDVEEQPSVIEKGNNEDVHLYDLKEKESSEDNHQENAVVEKDSGENQQENNSSTVVAPVSEESSTQEQNTIDSSPIKEDENSNQNTITEVFDVGILTTTTEGFAPLEVEFSIDGDVVSSAWDFSDGVTSNQKNAFHTFDQPGTYVVKLNVLDENNRDKKLTQTIIVKSNFPSNLNPIQNLITPNGDNYNDVFKISGENILKIEVFIQDNQGGIVCRLNSIEDVWDGTDQAGNIVAPGTYYVSGSAMGVDGESHTIKTAITVLK